MKENKSLVLMLTKIPNKVLFVLAAICTLITGSCIAAGNINEAKMTHGLTKDLLITEVIILIALLILEMLFMNIKKIYEKKVKNEAYVKYFNQVFNSKVDSINKVSSGKIFDAVKELAAFESDAKLMILMMMPSAIPLMTLLYKEFKYKPIIAVITIASLILSSLIIIIGETKFKWSDEAAKKKAVLQGITADNFINIRTMKFLNIGKYANDRREKAYRESLPYTVSIGRIIYINSVNVIRYIQLILALLLSKDNVEMLAFIILSNYTINNVSGIIIDYTLMIVETKAQRKVLADLKGDDISDKPIIDKDITLKDVVFAYTDEKGKETHQFHAENLVFKFKERTLITGESGEGKSSLANMLSGLIVPSVGEVPLYDTFYIWQETETLDDTLWHNIVFDNKYNVSKDEVLQLFKELNMLEWFLNELKDGFETLVGERGCKLSSGQKQRINIIRLILEMRYNPSKLFIIDEITSNLDNETRALAIDLINRNCDSTLICISHNEGFDKICEHHIEVKNHRFTQIK